MLEHEDVKDLVKDLEQRIEARGPGEAAGDVVFEQPAIDSVGLQPEVKLVR